MRILFLATLLLASADAAALNIQHFRPNTEGLGYLRLDGTVTLPQGSFGLGAVNHLVRNPLEFGRTANGNRLDAIVGWYWGWDLWGAFGLMDRWEVGLDLPFSLLTHIEPLNSAQANDTVSMGDLQLRTKWRFLTPEENSWALGAAVVPFLNLPTGDEDDFYGDRSVNGGLRGILERRFDRHLVSAHLGFRAREKETMVASGLTLLTVDEEFLFGLGWKSPVIPEKQWWVLSELNGSTEFASEATTPLEWDVAVQKRFRDEQWAATFGGGLGLTAGYGVPDFRLLASLRYVPVLPGKNQPVAAETEAETPKALLEPDRIVALEPTHFEVNRAVLLPESYPVLDAVVDLLRSNPSLLRVRVEGHTDSDGTEKHNLKLSQRRAEAVKKYLIEQGIDPVRLESRGWGETQPVASNQTAEFKAQNRRVEFHVVQVKE